MHVEKNDKEPLIVNDMRLVKHKGNLYALTRNNYYLECHIRSGEIQVQKMVEGKGNIADLSGAQPGAEVQTTEQAKMCTSKCPLFHFALERGKDSNGNPVDAMFVYNRCGAGTKHAIKEVVIEK